MQLIDNFQNKTILPEEQEKKAALFVATLAAFLTPFMAAAVNVALPSIGSELAMDAISLSWIATAYLLAAAIFLIPFGKIADIHGRKKIFTYGILLYTLFSLLLVFSPSGEWMIAFRFIQGIGGAMMFGTGIAILISVFPANERGKAIGINVAAVYLGLSMGPFIGGFLTEQLGWRSVFLANVFLGIIIIFSVFRKLKSEWAEAKGEKFDATGSILYSVSLTFLMFGFSKLPSETGIFTIITGVVILLSFIFWETKTKNPILDIKLFRYNNVFAFSNLAALINYSATFAITFLLSLYLQYVKALSPQTAGMVLVSQPIVMAMFSPFAGRLSDKIEPQIVASIGMFLITIGLAGFAYFIGRSTIFVIVLNLILLGLGFALFSSPNTNAVMSSVDRRFYGVASATIGTMRLTGQMLSMGVAMLLFAIYMGSAKITPSSIPQFVASMKIAFVIFSVLCFLGIFASLARGKVR